MRGNRARMLAKVLSMFLAVCRGQRADSALRAVSPMISALGRDEQEVSSKSVIRAISFICFLREGSSLLLEYHPMPPADLYVQLAFQGHQEK